MNLARLTAGVMLAVGLLLGAFLPAIYDSGAQWSENNVWAAAQLSSYLAPIIIGWAVAALISGRLRSLTAGRALSIPVIAWTTNVYLHQVTTDPWFIDSVGSGSVQSPTIQESLAYGLTGHRSTLVAALCYTIVGVVLARRGLKQTVLVMTLPVFVVLVASIPLEIQDRLIDSLLFGIIPFGIGYVAAADINGGDPKHSHPFIQRLRNQFSGSAE